MYFNLDRQKKQKILNNYKKELLEHQRKKQEAKKLKIQEERNFLIETEIKQQQSEEKILQEQNRKKKALMQEYLDMIKKTKNYLPGYHFQQKNNEVIINNWGKSKEEFYKENNINNFHTINHNYNNNLYDGNRFNNLSEIEKVRQIIRPVDSMNKFLTDEQNEKEVKSYFLKRKQNKENYYKNLFFSQHNDSVKKNLNLYGTEDILILKQKKKKLLTENPYRQKSENRFSNSYLENNPILNPENNMRYNKYFKELYPDISTERAHNRNYSINYDKITENNNNAPNNLINVEINDNYNNNNNNYNNNDLNEYNISNNYNNNYMNEKVENNMAKNGNNIINNFNNNKVFYYDYYKNNINKNNPNLRINNRLSRNYSDIYNLPKNLRNIMNYKFPNSFLKQGFQ